MANVSVIVPIYNCEKHLENTLKVLQKQTMNELEIILIDDGSKDNSAVICQKFTSTDDRFKYYYQENQGVSVARNNGMSIANGEYICFCDADDIPKPEMYERLYKVIEQNHADIVMCDYFSKRDNVNAGLLYNSSVLLNSGRILEEIIPNMIGHENDDDSGQLLWGCVWRCIFRKDIIHKLKVRFPRDTAFAEDLVFILRYLRYTESLFILNEVLYFYNNNVSSAMNSMKYYKKDLFLKRKSLMQLIFESLQNIGLNKKLRSRMLVTFRKYILECVGNTCIKCSGNTFFTAYRSVKTILNDEVVRETFKEFNTKNAKQLFIYFAISKKLALIILIYYRLRLGMRQLSETYNAN